MVGKLRIVSCLTLVLVPVAEPAGGRTLQRFRDLKHVDVVVLGSPRIISPAEGCWVSLGPQLEWQYAQCHIWGEGKRRQGSRKGSCLRVNQDHRLVHLVGLDVFMSIGES